MSAKFPIRVALMDDDFAALKWNADLLTRDQRTTVSLEAESPTELLSKLSNHAPVDVILLDVEYWPEDPPFSEFVDQVVSLRPANAVVCISQYGRERSFFTAVQAGVRGFLLKCEVRMSISSAVTLALRSDFLVSSRMLPLLEANWVRGKVVKLNSWAAHPALTPQLSEVFTLRILYGMSAPQTASEIHLAPATVEKYMQYAYQKLGERWGDERLLEGIEIEHLSPEALAFHLYTLPPAG